MGEHTASIFTFSNLKEELSSKLTQTDCWNLGRYFSLPPDQVKTIITSPLYSKNFLLALEERGYIHPSNVNRLTDALTELKINHTHLLTETYMKLRDQETEYDRFLAGLSAHLTFSITVKLCDNFEVTDKNKKTVISSQNPGLSFLLTIDKMGIINPSDVSKLETPLEEYRLLQAVAKIHEYQSLALSDKTKAQDEDKESLFLKCLQQKMKSWFETMTPVPWMKSCQWKSNDLFIASRLVLTNSGSKISSREVDRKSIKMFYIRKGIPITEEDIESMLNSGKKKVYLILDGLEEYNVHNIDRLGKLQVVSSTGLLLREGHCRYSVLCRMWKTPRDICHTSSRNQFVKRMRADSESEASTDYQETTLHTRNIYYTGGTCFNGLCKGNQQLFWQKDFVDRSVTNSKHG
ncbi:hypothetical protein BSL78_23475 [Apostichopus japonicus]|uniref:Uncharacterized protein n=1 Tax=Stichopus japonicus TaxID=307972 RepID=A0A2G8JVG9_STIJA|nr:hypothetical protein BSL78_23475 [Apostichopus japonicus]